MKILGFYITRTDWEFLYNYERETVAKVIRAYNERSSKYAKPRDSKGRFVSKQAITTQQLRDEVDNKHVPHWDYVKGAR